METIEISDIQVYKGGNWRSLRDKNIYKNGGWRTFGSGSGICRNGNWYVLKRNTMATIETADIQVYKGGSWRSLRDKSIFKNGTWKNFGTGSGICKNGNWYVLKSNTPPPVELKENKIDIIVYIDTNSQYRVDVYSSSFVNSDVTVQCLITNAMDIIATNNVRMIIKKGQIGLTNYPLLFGSRPVVPSISNITISPEKDSIYKYLLGNVYGAYKQ